ncbi:hypothetical protein RIF29_30555 [Crotalaria pallida]|uniref:Uncharacterized protein n=1 Tax=Crotalaria pallida TaxID=3830 RepID=A0AAN9EGM9_CROPI
MEGGVLLLVRTTVLMVEGDDCTVELSKRDRCPEVLAPYKAPMVVSPVVEVSNQQPVVVVDSPGGAVAVTESSSVKHVGKEGNLAAHAMGSRFDLLKEESTPLNSNIKPESRGSSVMGPSHVNSSSHVGVSKRVTKDFKIGPKAQTATKPHKLLAAGQQQRGSQNHKAVQAVDATPGQQQRGSKLLDSIEASSSDRAEMLAARKLKEEEILRMMKYKQKELGDALLDPFRVHYSMGEMEFLQRQQARGKGKVEVTVPGQGENANGNMDLVSHGETPAGVVEGRNDLSNGSLEHVNA